MMARPGDLDITDIVRAEVERITRMADELIEQGATDDIVAALRSKGWTCIPPFPVVPPENAADLAAITVLSRHGVIITPGERPLSALGWALGDGIPYEQGIREYGEALMPILGGVKP
ncbi:hypothetical protein SEA_PASCHALIS_13 [Microbacterium phage Paschalis]|uniref:Uncharacterized protein n=1 Tax=Microbacterium phage Paschalis TaxID=2992928 RepID=A0A2U8UPZ0_9CAUD|nr:hypothetical protein HOT30_gp13 [Microbacterium phage Paschalis]AWN05506.1 hypothetical protein SEA_PASCHALIS_13 [Microbacterium phage Paschalis]